MVEGPYDPAPTREQQVQEDEHEESRWLVLIAKECRACPECWDVPCGACQAGGCCDRICRCDDLADEPLDPRYDLEDE